MKRIKLQFETVPYDINDSYRLLVDYKLNDFYFWHFHPEIELVYINAAAGKRQVGNHTAKYQHGDLVLIGSGIPHLNFDYQIKTEYEIIVVHLSKDFLDYSNVRNDELHSIKQLLMQSAHGIVFSDIIKNEVGSRLLKLPQYDSFQQFLELLSILEVLSQDENKTNLHKEAFRSEIKSKEESRLKELYVYIDLNYSNRIAIADAANVCHMTNEAFCRYFKKMTKLTFTEFLNHYRITQSKRMIVNGMRISDIAFSTGYESLAYFSRTFKRITGQTPTQYKKAMTV